MHGFIPDPYEILGIARDATQREVKQAYRCLIKKFHPDHNPEKPEAVKRFKQIQQAYETLSSRRKHRLLSQTDLYNRKHPPPFFQNEYPFFNFYWTMKAYGDWIIKNMQSNHQGHEEKKDNDK